MAGSSPAMTIKKNDWEDGLKMGKKMEGFL